MSSLEVLWLIFLGYISSFCDAITGKHTVRKSRNMNRAKRVSSFLIQGADSVVEHYGKNN